MADVSIPVATSVASTPALPVGTAMTTPASHEGAEQCSAGRQITAEEGRRIVASASQWAGTPYSLVGNASVLGVRGDCSGSTNKAYVAAGFAYPYQATSSFIGFATATHRFVEIAGISVAQPGDVLWWPGHIAIYAEFDESDPNHTTSHTGPHGDYQTVNNMWTAFNSRTGNPYGPFDYRKFRPGEAPKVFRYFLHHGETGC